MISEVDPQLLEQVVHRKNDLFRLDDPGFELVDIEKRVQHALQRARRLVKRGDQLQGVFVLFILDLLRQGSSQQAKRLQGLPQVMAGGSEEARFAKIGAFCVPLGALQHRLSTLAFRDVVDRHKDLPRRKGFPADPPAVQPQHPPTECRQLDLDLVVLDDRSLGLGEIEEVVDRRNVQATVTDCDELPADGLPPLDRKSAVESLVREDNAQFFVEDDQGLPNGVDDAIRIQTSAPNIINMRERRYGARARASPTSSATASVVIQVFFLLHHRSPQQIGSNKTITIGVLHLRGDDTG